MRRGLHAALARALATILIALLAASCGGKAPAEATKRADRGPVVDRILVEAKTQEDIAIKDVAEGKSDVFWFATEGTTYKGLPSGIKSKLETYAVPSGSWSLLFNPYPNKAPYTVRDKSGRTAFNPFAIREVRFAMNFLVDRKRIIDEIVSGAGAPKYTPVTLGQPNSGRFATLASKLGITEKGDEAKALADIDAAMRAAAALPENKGRLAKPGARWQYDGADVELNVLIRVDDPNGRLKEGRYVADQLEKAGFKTNRLEYDRAKCMKIYRSGDPKAYEWNVYTEAWIGGQTYSSWDVPIAQHYAPWYSQMPGGGNAGQWNYENPEIDRLTKAAVMGIVKDADDYNAKCLRAVELGLHDAVRVFVVDTTSYFLANKARFNGRMAYGIGDGLNRLSALTADVKADASGPYKGQKVLRVTEFSARGSLFASAWDPIGPDGFSDTYTRVLIGPCSDMEFDFSPTDGSCKPLRAAVKSFKSAPRFEGERMLGTIPVPPEAVIWNAADRKWESGLAYVDLGEGRYGYVKSSSRPEYRMAVATGTYAFSYAKWHHGRTMDQNDYRYASALPYDLCFKKGAGDKAYEASYAVVANDGLTKSKGMVFNADGSITGYVDAYAPMDSAYNESKACPGLIAQPVNTQSVVCWEVLEAVMGLVADGKYVINSDGDYTEVDLIARKCVADIRAKLEEYAASSHLPDSLKGFVEPAKAVEGYRLAVAFIDAHGHAYISNGGFLIDRYDPATSSASLVATPFDDYPMARGEMVKKVETKYARINSIKAGSYRKGSELAVDLAVAEVDFPANKARAALSAKVKVTLAAGKDRAYEARMAKAGIYRATIPASDLAGLEPGSYTLIGEASLAGESATVDTTTFLVF
jgi:peptide/nickel transport system substrate-binding protein